MTDATIQPQPKTQPTSSGVTGSAGKVRSPGAVIIFSIITLGIYYLVWLYSIGKELKEYNGSGLGPIANLLFGIFLGIVPLFTVPNDVKQAYEADGKTATISAMTGFWNLIPFIGWIIWIVKVQGHLNALWEA